MAAYPPAQVGKSSGSNPSIFSSKDPYSTTSTSGDTSMTQGQSGSYSSPSFASTEQRFGTLGISEKSGDLYRGSEDQGSSAGLGSSGDQQWKQKWSGSESEAATLALQRAADVVTRLSQNIFIFTNQITQGGTTPSGVSMPSGADKPSSSGFLSQAAELFHKRTPEEQYEADRRKLEEKEAAFEKKRYDYALDIEKELATFQKRVIDMATKIEREAVDLERSFVKVQADTSRATFESEIRREKDFVSAEKKRLDEEARMQKEHIDETFAQKRDVLHGESSRY